MSNQTHSPSGPISTTVQEKPHAVLHITTRDGGTMERELVKAETRIGKGPENDLILGDAAVSTNHALIQFNGQKHHLIDVGSRNGTFLNDVRLVEPRELKHGDVIKLGHCTLAFRTAQPANQATVTLSATEILGASAAPPPPPTAPPTPTAPPLPSEDTVARALVHSKIVAQADVDKVQKNPRGRRLYRALLEEKVVTELGLRDLMSRTFNLQLVDLRSAELDMGMAQKLRPTFLREKLMMPLVSPPGELLLAVADPTDQAALAEIKKQAGRALSLRLATASEIASQLDRNFVPRLIGVLPSGEKLEVPINQPEIALGKATHNKVVLNDPTVSGTHAALLVRDGGYSVVDLGSSNGTFVNGTRLTTEAWTLQHGDKIQLGKVLLTFRNPGETVENKTARLSLEALEEIRRRTGLGATGTTVPPPGAVPATPVPVAPPLSPEEEAEKAEKKRRKKEKEREKNSWLSASSLSRIVAQVLAALISLGGAFYLVNRGNSNNGNSGGSGVSSAPGGTVKLSVPPDSWTGFSTGILNFTKPEASGVIAVPGGNGALLVDDGRKGELLWLPLDNKGVQAGALKAVPLNVDFADAEAITYAGNSYYYVITSQSEPNKANANTLIRFSFDAQTQTLRGQAELVSDLRGFLLKNVPALSTLGAPPGLQGGLNIEGMAYDPNNERLLLGLRSPFIGDQAILVPLKLINPQMPLSLTNLKVDEPSIITLSLEGQGFRDITYDAHEKTFLIISGSPETAKKTDFGLWEWSGKPPEQPRLITRLDETYKPEGITSATINGTSFVLIVGDAGSYIKLDYK